MQFNTDYFSAEVGTTFYVNHGEWEIIDKHIRIFNLTATVEFSCIQIQFTLKRRPYFLLVNIVLPVIFLSFLNILVFVIPADSGEKIGYGITVLLALSVFMSIIGSMLPRSSSKIPKVTLYLFILLIISMLTVIVSIVIVYLHHLEEKEVKHQKVKARYSSAVSKVAQLRRAVSVFQAPRDTKQDNPKTQRLSFASAATLAEQSEAPPLSHGMGDNHEAENGVEVDGVKISKPKPSKYKLIGKYIDFVSFIVFLAVWSAVTLGFMLDISI
ncbi:unnamed protein product [Lymnaea stagnalis]|uniref:Neurotransmitter-gated ion-channel transmembrane domain-containing protein n=1 Tax=Lymnaea stagnalis TaxID=6523 RepID=A0AAV2GZM1_LYMST